MGTGAGTADIYQWEVEDDDFWESTGRKVASRNLWISIPSLMFGFVVWLYWSVITVQMLELGFPFSTAQLFTLSAIAGLSGATLRIPSSFLIRVAGGRNTIFFTTALLMIPAVGTGFALLSTDSPLWVFQLLAFISGFGGGNFASSMSNISFFYPKRMQGLALGLNAGLGNVGVAVMLVVIPLVVTYGMFGGRSMILQTASGTPIGAIAKGTEIWIHNAGFVWLLVLVPLAFLAWFKMDTIRAPSVSPNIASPFKSFAEISGMLATAFIPAAVGLFLILPSPTGLGWTWAKYPIIALVIWATVILLKELPGYVRPNLERQFRILGNKHTWIMSVIYTMTFGSFIGYSAGFALVIKVIFGFRHVMVDGMMTHDLVNPNGPSALFYAWMGPFVGAFIRPMGGWISDKVGGARVTQWVGVVMIFSTLGVAYFVKQAYQSSTPEDYFVPFSALFLVLFAAIGVGNGSMFRTIATVFHGEQRGPVLGWTSAVAAYGVFVMPQEFGEQMANSTPEITFYAFAVFYVICLGLNWWYYLGPKAEYFNP